MALKNGQMMWRIWQWMHDKGRDLFNCVPVICFKQSKRYTTISILRGDICHSNKWLIDLLDLFYWHFKLTKDTFDIHTYRLFSTRSWNKPNVYCITVVWQSNHTYIIQSKKTFTYIYSTCTVYIVSSTYKHFSC